MTLRRSSKILFDVVLCSYIIVLLQNLFSVVLICLLGLITAIWMLNYKL